MSAEPLTLAPEVARDVLDHTLTVAPDECCGVLLGPEPFHATQVLTSENVHGNPRTEYEIAPDVLLEAVERTEDSETTIVGFYHSHPRGAAAFSETDRERGSWEDKVYLLCSLAPLAFVAGRWDGAAFEEMPVRVLPRAKRS